jgi:hypothetical protein
MMVNEKRLIFNKGLALLLFILCCVACNLGDAHKTVGNTKDTTGVNKAGGPPIRDTATISQDRRDSARTPVADSTVKGNADPSGHMTKPRK